MSYFIFRAGMKKLNKNIIKKAQTAMNKNKKIIATINSDLLE